MERTYFGDWFYECMFWGFLALLSCLWVWELVELLVAVRAAAPASDGEEEPDEWEKLSDEEKVYLRRFFK